MSRKDTRTILTNPGEYSITVKVADRALWVAYWLLVVALFAATLVILIQIAQLDATIADAERLLSEVRR